MIPNTVNLAENLLADMEDTQVVDMGDTKVDPLKILEFFQVGMAADIPAPSKVRGIVPLLVKKPKPSFKTKQHNYLNYICSFNRLGTTSNEAEVTSSNPPLPSCVDM
jgi:hypothetical protein